MFQITHEKFQIMWNQINLKFKPENNKIEEDYYCKRNQETYWRKISRQPEVVHYLKNWIKHLARYGFKTVTVVKFYFFIFPECSYFLKNCRDNLIHAFKDSVINNVGFTRNPHCSYSLGTIRIGRQVTTAEIQHMQTLKRERINENV